MAEEPRTPVAIRISRPYASEQDFLQHELETLTRTTVVLVGAQSRPQGVVLRFEVALSSGEALLRGEGRVVGFRPAGNGVDSGLTLRFTRLDARSKSLIDKAAAMREARARASLHPRGASVAPAAHAPAPPRIPAPPPVPEVPADPKLADTAPNAASAASLLAAAPAPVSAVTMARPGPQPREPASPPSSGTLPASARAAGSRSVRAETLSQTVANVSGPRRDELLDRLRERAKALSPNEVARLLASRKRA